MQKMKNPLRLIVIGFFVLLSAAMLLRSLTQPAYAERGDEIRPIVDTIPARVWSSSFLILSEYEHDRYGNFLWYYVRDLLSAPLGARIHSNDDIGIHTGATINAFVSTHGHLHSSPGVTFSGLPTPGYQEEEAYLNIPHDINPLIYNAANWGTYLVTDSNRYIYGLVFQGNICTVYRWQTGLPQTPFDRPQNQIGSIGISSDSPYGIFCDGQLWIKGVVAGKVGIGAHGSIRLMDDVMIMSVVNTPSWIPMSTDTYNFLTIATDVVYTPDAESDRRNVGIIIANTVANGRGNGANLHPLGTNQKDIIITAHLMAVNSMVTFEDQEGIVDSNGVVSPDYRGVIYFRGSLVQRYRGFVHRSDYGGIGYVRDFRYDERFLRTPPPFSMRIR